MARAEKNRRGRKRWGIAVIMVLCLLMCAFIGLMKLGQGSQDDASIEKGTALTDEEAESITFGDISDEDWEIFEAANEELSQIVAEYSNEDGYIDPDDTEAVLNAVKEQVDALYENGTVTYYMCTSDMVYFEYTSGLGAYYEPAIEGYLSGGEDDTSVFTITTVDMLADDVYYMYHAVDASDTISDILPDDYQVNRVQLENEGVTISTVLTLPKSQILLWYGHGGYTGVYSGKEFLDTRSPATKERLINELSNLSYDYKEVKSTIVKGVIESEGTYWGITSDFVREYISLDEGLVYLNACQSGRTNDLANAFLNQGADVVFVHAGTGDVKKFYAGTMAYLVMGYMAGADDGIFHTAKEALDLAVTEFADLTSSGVTIDGVYYENAQAIIDSQEGTQVAIRGDENYTLVSSIRYQLRFEDDIPEEEQAEIISGLTVRLTTADGTTEEYALDETDIFINQLEPGNYTIELYENGVSISKEIVTVNAHQRKEVVEYYYKLVTLEGYVYDTDGEPLSGVTVSADMTAGSDLWNTETQTNDEGYYALEVYGENSYALTYSKSGYTKQETTFEITPELFEEAQEGIPCVLEDVELSFDLYARYAEIVQEYEDAHGAFNLQHDVFYKGQLTTLPENTS